MLGGQVESRTLREPGLCRVQLSGVSQKSFEWATIQPNHSPDLFGRKELSYPVMWYQSATFWPSHANVSHTTAFYRMVILILFTDMRKTRLLPCPKETAAKKTTVAVPHHTWIPLVRECYTNTSRSLFVLNEVNVTQWFLDLKFKTWKFYDKGKIPLRRTLVIHSFLWKLNGF